MLNIIKKEDKELLTMGQNSNLLAQHINPQIWAYSFLQCLKINSGYTLGEANTSF